MAPGTYTVYLGNSSSERQPDHRRHVPSSIIIGGAVMNMTRRQFLAASAMAPFAAAAAPTFVKDSVEAQARPFDLGSVRLIDTGAGSN